jgi:predicted ATP-dependent serine protease
MATPTQTQTNAGANGQNGHAQDPAFDPVAGASNPSAQNPPNNSQGSASQANTTKSRFDIFSAGEAYQTRLPIKTIIEKLITAGSVNLLVGDGGIGKTYIVLDMAVSVVCDGQWLGYKTTKCPVLFIDEESGKRRLLNRTEAVLHGHFVNDPNIPIYFLSLSGFDLGTKADQDHLKNFVLAGGFGLVIIDALADVMPGRDENSVKDVQPIFLALRRIAEETQAAIIVIHHTNKSNSYRGSTAIKGAVDLMLQVELDKSTDIIKFETIKARDTEPINFAARAQFMTLDPQEYSLVSVAAPKKNKTRSKSHTYVLRYLRDNGTSTIDDIKDNADPAICAPRTAQNAVGELMNSGLVERANAGGQGVIAEYQLTQTGQAEAQSL